MLPETAPNIGLVLGSLWAIFFALVLLSVQFRWYLYTWEQRKSHDEWIVRNRKEIFAANGAVVYPFFYFFQGIAAPPSDPLAVAWIRILLHIMSIPFAVLLWDMGRLYGREFWTLVVIDFHHLGVFLALPFHITEDPMVAARTTRVFGWLWSVHIFQWIIAGPLPVLIAKGADAATVLWVFERSKEVYMVVSVYFVYDYFCGESQPGFGWNYQTVSLVTLWIGRFGYNKNYRRSMIIRRIEFPGSIAVVVSAVFFQRNIYRGASATICAYASILFAMSVFPDNRPGKWDPGHPAIAKILVEFERGLLASSNTIAGNSLDTPEHQELMYMWRENQLRLEEKYPLAQAILENNLKNLEAIVLKGGGDGNDAVSIYQPMRELKNLTGGELAVSIGNIPCVLLLITKAGLNPWENGHCEGEDNNIWELAKRFRLKPLLELRERLEPAALDAYPPISSSIFDRAAKIIRRF